LMFRRDILFTVVTVGILAAISATIHNLYTKLTEEEEDSRDFLAPLRTLCKLSKLAYERSMPAWYQIFLLLKSQPQLLSIYEAARNTVLPNNNPTTNEEAAPESTTDQPPETTDQPPETTNQPPETTDQETPVAAPDNSDKMD